MNVTFWVTGYRTPMQRISKSAERSLLNEISRNNGFVSWALCRKRTEELFLDRESVA